MAGGIWERQDKVRAGSYHRFEANNEREFFGVSGVVALPMLLDWGPEGEIVRIRSTATNEKFVEKFGKTRNDLPMIREALKGGYELLVYRVDASGTAAELDLTADIPVVAHAKYPGTLGNQIQVQIQPMVNGDYSVVTVINNIVRDKQEKVKHVSEIKDNAWVHFENKDPSDDEIKAAAGGSMTGGTNGTATVAEYTDFLNQLEVEEFNVYGLLSDDSALKKLFVDASTRYTNELGKMVMCVVSDYTVVDNERVSSIANGVVLEDSTVINKTQAVAWYAGASASKFPVGSLTYVAYPDAIGPDTKLPAYEIENLLAKGQIVFTAIKDKYGNNIAVVEQDRNCRIKTTDNRPTMWQKNEVVRSIYTLVSSIGKIWHEDYLGKIANNKTGRTLFRSDIGTLMDKLVAMNAFENFNLSRDVDVFRGDDINSVVCNVRVQAVGSMEKLYTTVTLDIAEQNRQLTFEVGVA